jgi:hypothetical protein
MIKLARDNEIVPVLITAPSSHTEGNEPGYLTDRWLNDLEDLIPIHQKYVNIVREVVEEHSVVVIDLVKEFENLPTNEDRRDYFLKDGIHLTSEGKKNQNSWSNISRNMVCLN